MTAIIFYLASMGTILSIVMVVPILIGLGFREFEVAAGMFFHVASWGFISTGVLLANIGRNRALSRLGGLYLCLASWIIFPLVVAIAIMDLLDISYVKAVFEAFSAFTTNGASIIGNPEIVPNSMIAFLSVFQWLGGLATLVTFSIILAPFGFGGLHEETHATLGHSLISSPKRLHQFCLELSQIYLTLSALCFSALLLVGVKAFDGFVLSTTALSTGGILPGNENLDETANASGLIVMALFLIVGATSIYWHRMLAFWQSEYLVKHRESYYLLVIWALLTIAFSSAIYAVSGGSSQIQAVSEGLFNSASIISTSGLQSRPGIFALMPAILILALLFLGGGCFSSSGGIKLYRMGGMFSQSLHELNRLIYPGIVRPAHFGSHQFDIGLMKAMWSFFATAVVVVFVGAILLTVTGLEFQAAFTASVANFTTAGPAYGPEWSPGTAQGWPDYFEMGPLAHVILVILMLAGRLELIALIALFNFSYWRSR